MRAMLRARFIAFFSFFLYCYWSRNILHSITLPFHGTLSFSIWCYAHWYIYSHFMSFRFISFLRSFQQFRFLRHRYRLHFLPPLRYFTMFSYFQTELPRHFFFDVFFTFIVFICRHILQLSLFSATLDFRRYLAAWRDITAVFAFRDITAAFRFIYLSHTAADFFSVYNRPIASSLIEQLLDWEIALFHTGIASARISFHIEILLCPLYSHFSRMSFSSLSFII